MFDLLIVAVLRNAEKEPLFSVTERIEMLRRSDQTVTSVRSDVFDDSCGLRAEGGVGVILRGIRAPFPTTNMNCRWRLMNRKLEPRLETGFHAAGLSLQLLELEAGPRNCAAWGVR